MIIILTKKVDDDISKKLGEQVGGWQKFIIVSSKGKVSQKKDMTHDKINNFNSK